MAAPAVRFILMAGLVLNITIAIMQQDSTTTSAQEILPNFPFFLPSLFIHTDRTPPEVFPGDELEIVVVVKNENRTDADFVVVTQIIEPSGYTGAILYTDARVQPDEEFLRLVKHWQPEQESVHSVDVFLLETSGDAPRPLSDKLNTSVSVRPEHTEGLHDLRIELNIDNPDGIIAGQQVKGSVELVNYAPHPELVQVVPDYAMRINSAGIPMEERPIPECTFWPGLRLDNFVILPGEGGRLKLNEGDTISLPFGLDHEDSYDLTWSGKVNVQEEGGVDCYYLTSTASINVTAPEYDNVRLVIETDRESYLEDQPVKFTVSLENDTDEPWRIEPMEVMIHVRDARDQNALVFVSPFPMPAGTQEGEFVTVVEPHSKHTFRSAIPEHQGVSLWDWDQKIPTLEGITSHIEPGVYYTYATFSSPPMKSERIIFTIQ